MQQLSQQWLVDNLNARSQESQGLLTRLNSLQVWNVEGLITLREQTDVAILISNGIALGRAAAIKKFAQQAQASQQGIKTKVPLTTRPPKGMWRRTYITLTKLL